MGYDDWKTRSPDDEHQEECFHEYYEADINGRATCDYCGHRWWLTDKEIELERELHAEYDRTMRREERRQWVKGWWLTLAFWKRWRRPAPIDDELPF